MGRKSDPPEEARRDYIKTVGALAAGLVVGGVAGWLAKAPVEVPGPTQTVEKTVTKEVTKEVTKTVTGTPPPTTPPPTTPPPTTPPPTTPPVTPTIPEELKPYIAAADGYAEWLWPDTVLTKKQLYEECEFFAKATAPYRGMTVHVMYEAIQPATWEEENLKSWWEKITGTTITYESMSNWETIVKSQEDAKLKAGIYDCIGSDQDMTAFYAYYGSGMDWTDFWAKHPEVKNPYIDVEDFYARASYSDWRNGHLMALHGYNGPDSTMYRKDMLTDPTNVTEFKAQYGYDMKTPWTYWREAIAAGKEGSEDYDWTVSKAIDMLKFFTIPEENRYGTIFPYKPGDWMGYIIADGFDDIFQLASPAPAGKWPMECSILEPNITPYGVHVEKDTVYGSSTTYGGTLDSAAGIAMYKAYLEDWPSYCDPRCYEMDHGEAYMAWCYPNPAGEDPAYPLWIPNYTAVVLLINSAESYLSGTGGTKFEMGPTPVYSPNFVERKPRGYIDPSGWVISNYIDDNRKALTMLFIEFLTSKSNDLKKCFSTGVPIRTSTINDKRYYALNAYLGGIPDIYKEQLQEQFGSDARWVIYPETMSVEADTVIDCFQKKVGGEETAKKTAAAFDKWIIDNGWMEKKLV